MSFLRTRNTSTQLLQSSLRVLWQHPKLLGFTLLTFALGLVFAFFYFGLLLLPASDQSLFTWERWATLPATLKAIRSHPVDASHLWVYGYMALFYVLSMLLTTFLNVAAYHEIMRAMGGEPVSLSRGLRFACSRIPSVLAWGLFAAIVGMLIRLLAERLGWLGRGVLGLFGVTWSLAAVFVIPIMIRETDPNPIALMRKSAATLRRTCGETVVGYASLTLGMLLPMIALLFVLSAFTAGLGKLDIPWLMAAALGGQLLFVLGISSLMSLANAVYRCALYVYATEGVVPEPYTAELMDAAWRIKTTATMPKS